MKKRFGKIFCALAIFTLLASGVSAASQLLWGVSGLTLSSGTSTSRSGLNASYDYAYVDIQPTSIWDTYNASSSRVTAYRLESGSYRRKTAITVNIGTNYSAYMNVGKVGAGTWQIVTAQTDGANDFVSWSGSLGYYSQS